MNDSWNNSSLAMIVKPVGSRCNMKCSYCYYLDKGQFSSHLKQTRMSYDLLEKLIRQMIEANPGPVVSFTWHGGEPTLAKIEFYKKVVELQKKYLPKGWQAWNNLQTNGLFLNEEWCEFLKENHFDVGLSIDGDELTHDKNRKDLLGNPTFSRIAKSIRLLQRYGIQPDLLCTVNSDSEKRPLEVYRSLRSFDTGWIQFIPVIVRNEKGEVDPISATKKGYGQFLCTIFDEWITHDLGKLDVQLFAESARIWAGGQAGVCTMASSCGRVLVAEEDGSLYSCDHFVDQEHRVGNLMDNPLSRVVNTEFQKEFGWAKKERLCKECKACPWLKLCNGGCPKDRFEITEKEDFDKYYLCESLKQFFSHAEKLTYRAMELSSQRKTPDEIMKIIQKEVKELV